MVLFEHTINDDGTITIKESELHTELERLVNRMSEAKANDDFDKWTYLAGQIKTIKDILRYFQFPEGRDNTDAVEFGR